MMYVFRFSFRLAIMVDRMYACVKSIPPFNTVAPNKPHSDALHMVNTSTACK
jgi:hypothetical protein